MKIIVCGGRDYDNYSRLYHILDDLNDEAPISHIIVGGASGADHWGEAWAYHNRIPFTVFKTDWKTHGRAAGPIRNERMLKEGKPDLVVAFPGGRGTRNMVSLAKASGVEVIEIDE